MRKSHTTPYHPMGNGSVERFNRTLGNMIRALAPDTKANWPRRLQTLTFMYNSTAHETTGYAPFFLMFGRVPRLPVDVLFRTVLNDPAVISYDKYLVSLTKDLEEAMVIARGGTIRVTDDSILWRYLAHDNDNITIHDICDIRYIARNFSNDISRYVT